MKLVLKSLAVFTLLISAAFAQTQLVSDGGGILTGAKKLTLAAATITGEAVNGNPPIAGNLGTVSFVTPGLSSGTIAAGGIFEAGGAFTVSVPGISFTYLAKFVAGGTWVREGLANGSHFYELTANLVDANGVTGVVEMQTSSVGTGNFEAPVMVARVAMVVNN